MKKNIFFGIIFAIGLSTAIVAYEGVGKEKGYMFSFAKKVLGIAAIGAAGYGCWKAKNYLPLPALALTGLGLGGIAWYFTNNASSNIHATPISFKVEPSQNGASLFKTTDPVTGVPFTLNQAGELPALDDSDESTNEITLGDPYGFFTIDIPAGASEPKTAELLQNTPFKLKTTDPVTGVTVTLTQNGALQVWDRSGKLTKLFGDFSVDRMQSMSLKGNLLTLHYDLGEDLIDLSKIENVGVKKEASEAKKTEMGSNSAPAATPVATTAKTCKHKIVDLITGKTVSLNRNGDLQVFDRFNTVVKTVPLGLPIDKVEHISLQGNEVTIRYGNGMIGEDVIDLSMV